MSEATKLLRELQQELRQSSQEENLEAASSDKADDSMDAQSGSVSSTKLFLFILTVLVNWLIHHIASLLCLLLTDYSYIMSPSYFIELLQL